MMSKTTAKKAKSTESDGPLLEPEQILLLQRIALHGAIAIALLVGIGVGIFYLRQYVEKDVVAAKEPPVVRFKTQPAWMTDLVAHQLAATFRPAKPKSVFDHDVLVQTTKRLKANPWVAQVRQVRRMYANKPGDTIEVDCDFRAPIALVQNGSDFWFVDRGGIKLPEKFARADVYKIILDAAGHTNIRVIDGVRNPPPAEAGRRWLGEDLIAALDMVDHLNGQDFADDIVKIDVHNHAGRVDPREAQIVLVTKQNTQVRWGRPWRASDSFIEVKPERKLANLRKIVTEFGRIDAKQKWIDIRFDTILYPSPAADANGAQADVRR